MLSHPITTSPRRRPNENSKIGRCPGRAGKRTQGRAIVEVLNSGRRGLQPSRDERGVRATRWPVCCTVDYGTGSRSDMIARAQYRLTFPLHIRTRPRSLLGVCAQETTGGRKGEEGVGVKRPGADGPALPPASCPPPRMITTITSPLTTFRLPISSPSRHSPCARYLSILSGLLHTASVPPLAPPPTVVDSPHLHRLTLVNHRLVLASHGRAGQPPPNLRLYL
nr:hypothetical protein CFP56_00752 [Quercus suber]